MLDALMLIAGVGFFALALAYVTACDRMWEMLIDYALGGIVTIVIMVYLVIALIKPERF